MKEWGINYFFWTKLRKFNLGIQRIKLGGSYKILTLIAILLVVLVVSPYLTCQCDKK